MMQGVRMKIFDTRFGGRGLNWATPTKTNRIVNMYKSMWIGNPHDNSRQLCDDIIPQRDSAPTKCSTKKKLCMHGGRIYLRWDWMLGLTRLEILQPSRLLTDRMKNETEEIWREEMATPTQSYPKTHLKNPFPAPNKNYFGADQISEAKNQPHPVSKPKSPT